EGAGVRVAKNSFHAHMLFLAARVNLSPRSPARKGMSGPADGGCRRNLLTAINHKRILSGPLGDGFQLFTSKTTQLSRYVWSPGTATIFATALFLGPNGNLPKTPIRSGVSAMLTLGMVVTREFCKKVTRRLFASLNTRDHATGMENSQVIHNWG